MHFSSLIIALTSIASAFASPIPVQRLRTNPASQDLSHRTLRSAQVSPRPPRQHLFPSRLHSIQPNRVHLSRRGITTSLQDWGSTLWKYLTGAAWTSETAATATATAAAPASAGGWGSKIWRFLTNVKSTVASGAKLLNLQDWAGTPERLSADVRSEVPTAANAPEDASRTLLRDLKPGTAASTAEPVGAEHHWASTPWRLLTNMKSGAGTASKQYMLRPFAAWRLAMADVGGEENVANKPLQAAIAFAHRFVNDPVIDRASVGDLMSLGATKSDRETLNVHARIGEKHRAAALPVPASARPS